MGSQLEKPTPLASAFTSLMPHDRIEIRQGYADVGDQSLHYVEGGDRDSYLGSELAEPHSEDVPNLDRVERLPDASHWVHHDAAERVNQLLIDFLT